MNKIVFTALDRELDLRDWKAHLGKPASTDLCFNAVELLVEERQTREPDPN
ncbi:MAG: hypothetical protein OXH91_01850 [Chloroflexota bacterium]|nr:hypothetical protein [Chloroflexota bacterium]